MPSISGFIAQIDATLMSSSGAEIINEFIKDFINGSSSRALAYCTDPISPTDTKSLFAPAFISSKTMSIVDHNTGGSIIRAYVFYHPENVSVEISTEIIRKLASLQ